MAGRNSRVGWTKLSAAQRARYISAGKSGRLSGSPLTEAQTRNYYESGASLSSARGHGVYDARGHKRLRPSWAAPKQPTERGQVSLLTDRDRRTLRAWVESRAYPKWLPRNLRFDVAAILSELDVGPPRWRHFSVEAQRTGRYTLTVEITGRPTLFVTTLPDWGAVSELGELLNTYSREAMCRNRSELARIRREWRTKGGRELHIGVDITETDRLVDRVQITRGNRQVDMKITVKKPAKKVGKGTGAKKIEAKRAAAKKATPPKRSVKKKQPPKRK